eukprot:476950_1
MKNQPNYVEVKHENLKMELLYHDNIDCTVSSWNNLDEECKVKVNCKKGRKILSNGANAHIYRIKEGVSFEKHIHALLLYTNYTNWCSTFCSILRKQNKEEISTVANWAKLLIECVQCFGSWISDDMTFYRGIDREFTFKKFIARFNVPLSTTSELTKAAEFAGFSDGTDGLVIELCSYDSINTVFAFDCSAISAFEEEEERLFYGGDTILRIESIRQLVANTWTNYTNYVKAIAAITRLMNGLSTGKMPKIVKRAIRLIFNGILATDESSKTKIESLPKYIVDKLINYHIVNRTAPVELDYDVLITSYKWMKNILVKDDNKCILDFYNICSIFHNSINIIITMTDQSDTEAYEQSIESMSNKRITSQFCSSLKNDLLKLSKANIFINKLQLSWSTMVPLEGKFQIINLFANDASWQIECTSSTIQIMPQKTELTETTNINEDKDINGALNSIQGL